MEIKIDAKYLNNFDKLVVELTKSLNKSIWLMDRQNQLQSDRGRSSTTEEQPQQLGEQQINDSYILE